MAMGNTFRGTSVLSMALMKSASECIQTNTYEEKSDQQVQFISNDGDIYLPFNKKLDWRDNNTFNNKRDIDFNRQRASTFDSFIDIYVSREVTTVHYKEGALDLNQLLKDLALDDSIYGVIIQTENYMVNPLHPMLSFMVTSGYLELPKEADIHIFSFSKRGAEEMELIEDDLISKIEKDYENFFVESSNLIKKEVVVKQKAKISSEEVDRIIEYPFIDRIDTNIKITREERSDENTSLVKSLVIPCQIAIGAMAHPYYGMAYIDNPGNTNITGYSLGAMFTGNIKQSTAQNWGRMVASAGYDNVCTGSNNSTSRTGWFTLSRVNLSSMYYSDIIVDEQVFEFIKASKNIAAQIWEVNESEANKEEEETVTVNIAND